MTGAARSEQWHVDADSLRRWVDGTAGPLIGVSVEQHVLKCARCRAEVAVLVPAQPLQSVWDKVLADVEVPRIGLAQRVLQGLGLSTSDSLVLTSAVTIRLAWLLGVIAVLLFSTVAGLLGPAGGIGLFVLGAPLVPVVGVAAAYGPAVDPSYEAVLASPYSMVRLVLLRTASVLVTSIPPVTVAGLLLPTSPVVAVVWLLPAAGFVALVLTASIWIQPAYAAAAIAIVWVAAVAWTARNGDPLGLFAAAYLLAYLAVIVVAGLILLVRMRATAPSWRLR